MPHIVLNGERLEVSNIFCIGRNYREHAKELGNAVPEEPLAFLKPTGALLQAGSPIVLPPYSESVHYECELVLYIGRTAEYVSAADAMDYVAGVGIGLDLTARDVQSTAKSQGLPWLKAKGFRGSACVSHFVSPAVLPAPDCLGFSLHINGGLRQQGDSGQMMFSVPQLIAFLSATYGLPAGSLIYTGTPEGVGELHHGDSVQLSLHGHIDCGFQVA